MRMPSGGTQWVAVPDLGLARKRQPGNGPVLAPQYRHSFSETLPQHESDKCMKWQSAPLLHQHDPYSELQIQPVTFSPFVSAPGAICIGDGAAMGALSRMQLHRESSRGRSRFIASEALRRMGISWFILMPISCGYTSYGRRSFTSSYLAGSSECALPSAQGRKESLRCSGFSLSFTVTGHIHGAARLPHPWSCFYSSRSNRSALSCAANFWLDEA